LGIQILIGGQDYTQYVDLSSVKASSNIAVTSDTASLDVVIPKRAVPRPKGGQEIRILNGAVAEFGGVMLTPTEDALATDVMIYHVKCRDYTYYFDKYVVTDTYANMSTGNIVKSIVQTYASGFTTNNVQGTGDSFLITEIIFDHKAPSVCVKKLADDTAFQWWIDYDKDVHFGPTMTVPSPLPNNTLDADTDTANYSNLQIIEDVSQLRNQIYLQGYKVPADYSITQDFSLDGQSNVLILTYEPMHKLSDITVVVNGTTLAKKLDITGGLPNSQIADGTAYINYKQQRVRFNVAPAAGTASITYVPMFEMIKMYNDPNALAEMKARDNMDGVYEFGIRDQQLSSVDSTLADTRGQLELYKYAYPHISGQFDSFLQGWQAGQYFTLVSQNRMDGEFAGGITLYVVKVAKQIVSHPANGSPTFKYTVSFSDTPYVL
jgi:hypothetical protein